MNNELFICMYHYTRDISFSRYPGIKGMNYDEFEEQLIFFRDKFNVVTMEDVLRSFEGYSLPKNPLLLTFDDGYIDNFNIAYPLLKKYGFQGSFFISGKPLTDNTVLDDSKTIMSDLLELIEEYRNEYGNSLDNSKVLYEKYAIESRLDDKDTIFIKRMLQTILPEEMRMIICDILFKRYVGLSEAAFSRELYLNRNQIRCMYNDGMFIGVHGYNHQWLGKMPQDAMEKDICKSLEVLEEFIDKEKWVMNYPYGSYNDSVIKFISNKGCKMALTTEVNCAEVSNKNRYIVPRLDCIDFPPRSDNYQRYYGGQIV